MRAESFRGPATKPESTEKAWCKQRPSLREALGLSPEQKVFSLTPLGYPRPEWQRTPQESRKSLEEIATNL
jgi:hypothetical protein